MTTGGIYTIAGNGASGFYGDGGPATSAALDRPGGLTVDAAGNLLFADQYNGRIRVVAAHTGTFYGQQMTEGDIYTIAGGGTGGLGDGGPATSAELNSPLDMALDAAGNVLIDDSYILRIRMVAVRTGHLLRPADDHGRHLHHRRGRRGSGSPATAARPPAPDSTFRPAWRWTRPGTC